MLRFNWFFYVCLFSYFRISIHPMLRFNNALETKYRVLNVFQYILCYGSTGSLYWKPRRERKFQYILCYGSTSSSFIIIKIIKKFQYILCYGSTVNLPSKSPLILKISIHPMLRFNSGQNVPTQLPTAFQYILCYGSTMIIPY